MKSQKKDDSIVADPTLEAQAQALVDAPQTALVPKEDFRVEQVKKSNGQGERLVVRAASGKFTKLVTAVAASDAKAAQQFLAEKVKNEAGVELSRKAHLREALFSGAIKAAEEPKALGNAVKSFEALNVDAALTQAKERMLVDDSNIQNPVRIVVIAPVTLMHPEVLDDSKKTPEKKSPSFAASEVVYTNPPRE